MRQIVFVFIAITIATCNGICASSENPEVAKTYYLFVNTSGGSPWIHLMPLSKPVYGRGFDGRAQGVQMQPNGSSYYFYFKYGFDADRAELIKCTLSNIFKRMPIKNPSAFSEGNTIEALYQRSVFTDFAVNILPVYDELQESGYKIGPWFREQLARDPAAFFILLADHKGNAEFKELAKAVRANSNKRWVRVIEKEVSPIVIPRHRDDENFMSGSSMKSYVIDCEAKLKVI